MHPRFGTKKARRILVLSALIICLAEILAGFLIDRAPLEIRYPDASQIIRAVRQRGTSPDIIFFGTSRFQVQFSAEIVEQELAKATSNRPPTVFNAGISYGDPVAIDFLSAKLLEAGVRPSMAVIELSPETVSRRNFALQLHLTRQFTWANALNFLPYVVYSNAVPRVLSTRFIPLYLFRQEFRKWAMEGSGLQWLLCCPTDKTNPTQTHAPADANMTSAERLVEGAKATRDRLRAFQIGGIAPRALERLIERYKGMEITTILLGVSVSSPVRKEYGPEIDAAFLAYMQKLSARYDVYFVDYRDRVPDELFKAGYYTTEAGTSYASRLLAREVIAPLWRNRSSENNGAGTEVDTSPLSDVEGYLHSQKGGDR